MKQRERIGEMVGEEEGGGEEEGEGEQGRECE